MTRRRTASFTTMLALAGALAAGPARAEMIDHGALQELFGEPVTTSATGQPQRASEAPVSMVIVTADEIRRSGARDIPGVLRHVGGVDVLEWTNGHTDVSVRGYNREFNSRVLVLIDGRQVYADHYGFVLWDAIPIQLAEIRQIEVVKGPNAALFGFNAVAGVINIVTYNPEADDIGEASAIVGTQDLIGASAVETFRLSDRLSVRLSAGGQAANDYATPIPAAFTQRWSTDDERRAASLDSMVELSEDVHLRLDATYSEAGRNEVAPSLRFVAADYTTSSIQGRLTADTSAGLVEVTAYTNRVTEQISRNPAIGVLDFDSRSTVVRLQDLLTLGTSHTVRASIEYRRNSLGTTSVRGGRIFYDIYSVGGMWDWKITPGVSLTNAVRFDHLELGREGTVPVDYPFTNDDWDRDLDEISFNSGLVWRASEADTVRLIAARGVQLPNLTHLGGIVVNAPFVNITGVPTLEPSTVTNYEAGWDHEIEALDASIGVSLFYQETEEVVNIEGGIHFSPTAVYVSQANIGDSSTIGLALHLKGRIGEGWRWNADYRLQDVDDDYASPFDVTVATSNYEDTTPEHLFIAGLGWSGGRWEIDGYLRHQSGVLGILPTPSGGAVTTPIDAYTALDGRIGYMLADHMTLAISGRNLGSAEQRQTAGPEIERSVMGTLTVRY